ncbi:hypothetical protein DFH09DRAFT_1095506 [Mycena vulgaris]|nr:hypothetical protein DFH09DRAFT_1095506 [Mycena vulgaris]
MAPPARVNRAKTKARARVRVPVTTVNRDGINVPEMCTLNAKACTELAEQTNREMLEHIAGLSEDRLRVFLIGFPVPIVLRSTSVGFPGRGESAKLNGDASPAKPTGRSGPLLGVLLYKEGA